MNDLCNVLVQMRSSVQHGNPDICTARQQCYLAFCSFGSSYAHTLSNACWCGCLSRARKRTGGTSMAPYPASEDAAPLLCAASPLTVLAGARSPPTTGCACVCTSLLVLLTPCVSFIAASFVFMFAPCMVAIVLASSVLLLLICAVWVMVRYVVAATEGLGQKQAHDQRSHRMVQLRAVSKSEQTAQL